MRISFILSVLVLSFLAFVGQAQQLPNTCNPLLYYNAGAQQLVYKHNVPTPWFAVRMTAEWVATIDTAFVGMGVDRAPSSGNKFDTLYVRVLANSLPTYFILDQLTVLIGPNLQGLVVDGDYIVEFAFASPIAWIDPPNDFYLAWKIGGPAGDVARLLMHTPARDPLRSVIINANNTTTLATDFMRTKLQLGSTDSVDFRAEVRACWPYGTPVELTSFTARYEDGAALLEWHTATEENNSGFIVERLTAVSEAGMLNLWQRIGFVEGNGTTKAAHSYGFRDEGAAEAADHAGVVRYRLRQVDFDGRSELSPVVEINTSSSLTFTLGQSYPNPVRADGNSATVILTMPEEQHARLELFDVLGRPVALVADRSFAAGRHRLEIPVSGLRSGAYYYRLTAADRTLTRRLSVIE